MTVVQQAREFLALGVVPIHRRLEQRFLVVTRHVAPNVHSSPALGV
ncbi:hypothetical protein [Bradyrhizobium sp. URHC0002]